MKVQNKEKVVMRFAVSESVDEKDAVKFRGRGNLRSDNKIISADFDADEIGKQIADALGAISNKIQAKTNTLAPDKLTVSLSGAVSGSVGIIWVARGSANARIDVTAEWNFNHL